MQGARATAILAWHPAPPWGKLSSSGQQSVT